MSKRNILLCFLLLILTAFSSIAFAAEATASITTATPPPYASIVAYNQNNINQSKPEASTLGVFDIINMTPWNISVGPGPAGTAMLQGMQPESGERRGIFHAEHAENAAFLVEAIVIVGGERVEGEIVHGRPTHFRDFI